MSVPDAETAGPTARRGRRAAIGEAVFPVAAPSRARPLPRAAAYLAAFLAGIAYLVLIPAGRSHLFRVWAEDGKEWLSDAARDVPLSHLFDPLGGYFHAVPRVLAQAVVTVLPVDLWAVGMAVGAAAVRVGCALLVFHVARGHVPSSVARFAIAASVVLLPTGNSDTVNNAANLHWFLFFALCWTMLWRPRTRAGSAGAILFTAAAGLSVPLGLVLSPLAIARIVLLPRWRDKTSGLVLLVTAGAVLAVAIGADRPRAEVDAGALALSAATRSTLVMLIGPQAAGDLIVASGGRLWPIVAATAAAMLVVLGLAGAAFALGRPPERVLLAGLVLLGALCGVASLAVNWQDFLAVHDELRTPRYSTLPALLLFAALVVSLVVIARRRRPVAIAAGALVGILVVGGAAWQLADDPQAPGSPVVDGITWEDALDDARTDCREIGHENVKVAILPHDGWTAVLPCDLLD
ncbi:hypothetical protein N8K70_05810 [Microbacterium betulae]|uniref:Uncharacterized protein n=1 Tax=Microbacterium betulae TaxID=2981139 RepID=A0AA97FKW5_9MICO|nr:hypothetical protein [Microbacterium sp. AB]WOF24185.1 hypothetical protein N8K70_05810 [Microbacterium sp. AB]